MYVRMYGWLGLRALKNKIICFHFFVAETSIYRVLVFLIQVIEHNLLDQTVD